LICILTGLLAFVVDRNWRTFSLCVLLIWQGSLYIAAPLYSLLSLQREAALGAHVRITEQGKPLQEQSAARWVVTFSMVLIGAFSLIRFLPSPSTLPGYARFLPADLSPAQIIGREPTTNPPASATLPPTLPSSVTARATVKVESANCRSKPKTNAERVTILYKGQEVGVLGRNADPANPWWYIKIPNENAHCWLWGMTTKLTGNLNAIPIIP
jgi:hypothetical protein